MSNKQTAEQAAKPEKIKPSLYAFLIDDLKRIASEHGYNLCIHGSLNRDFDLIAFPWRSEVKPHSDMVKSMVEFLGGQLNSGSSEPMHNQPHRIWYGINLWRNTPFTDETDKQYYIDLSVFVTQQQAVNPWVKASERTPDKVLDRHPIKAEGLYELGWFDPKKSNLWLDVVGCSFHDVYWFDESLLSSQPALMLDERKEEQPFNVDGLKEMVKMYTKEKESYNYFADQLNFTAKNFYGRAVIPKLVIDDLSEFFTNSKYRGAITCQKYGGSVIVRFGDGSKAKVSCSMWQGEQVVEDNTPVAPTPIDMDSGISKIKAAHSHGWFQRERLDSPDRCGYEGKFPSNWENMDYEEKENWFFNQFLLSTNQTQPITPIDVEKIKQMAWERFPHHQQPIFGYDTDVNELPRRTFIEGATAALERMQGDFKPFMEWASETGWSKHTARDVWSKSFSLEYSEPCSYADLYAQYQREKNAK